MGDEDSYIIWILGNKEKEGMGQPALEEG